MSQEAILMHPSMAFHLIGDEVNNLQFVLMTSLNIETNIQLWCELGYPLHMVLRPKKKASKKTRLV